MYDRRGRVIVGNRVAFAIVLDREKPYDATSLGATFPRPSDIPSPSCASRLDRYRGGPRTSARS
jgi:hypothetical protein